MSWNEWTVVDMDSHIMERPAEMYDEYIDPDYAERWARLKGALVQNTENGGTGAIAASRLAVMAPVVSDNALGGEDTFGMVPREFILHPTSGRKNFGRPGEPDLPVIRKEVSWDPKMRVEDMDLSHVDIGVLFPTHVSSYCALRDVGFENALYRAYHRWVSEFCSYSPHRLKWTLVANMRDSQSAVEEIKYWYANDPNMVGVYFSPQGPDGMLLDDRRLFPIYAAAEALDLPILAHGGTARPPYSPGTFDLQGMWFLQHGLGNPWAGMAALGALIGGGVFDRFVKLRGAIVETACGWLPSVMDRFDTHYRMSPNHTPALLRSPTHAIKDGRYFHGIDTWETTLDYVIERMGSDMLLFATDWPHGDTAWPQAVNQLVEWKTISDNDKRKILGENAMRLCPRLAS